MTVTATWTWNCDICSFTQLADKPQEVDIGNVVYSYMLPPKWTWHDGKMICPNHAIAIDPPAWRREATEAGWRPAPADLPFPMCSDGRGPITKTWTDNKAEPPD